MTNQTYTSILHENKYLIIKTVEGNQPFVIASCYGADVAEQICKLLNEEAQKGE